MEYVSMQNFMRCASKQCINNYQIHSWTINSFTVHSVVPCSLFNGLVPIYVTE